MNALVRRDLANQFHDSVSSLDQSTLLEIEASHAAGITPLQNSHQQLLSELVGQKIAGRVRDALESQLLGRIRQLRVSATDKFVILTGSCNSFYTKQLAQHVAMELLDAQRLVNNIAVLPAK